MRGYPTVAEIHAMEHADFLREFKLWATEYILALPDAGLHFNLSGKVKHPKTGQMVREE